MTTSGGVGLILFFTINYALSVQQSSILSNLYKTAAQENRPMILVVDGDKANKDVDHYSKNYFQKRHGLSVKKQVNFKEDAQKPWPLSLLQHSGSRHYHLENHHSHDVHDHDHEASNHRFQSRNWNSRARLDREDDVDRVNRHGDRDRRNRNRYNRDRRDRSRNNRYSLERDRRDRYNRPRRDRDDRDRRDRDRHDRDRDNSDSRDRDADDTDWRDRSKGDSNRGIDRTLRALLKPQEKASDDPTTSALRSSVIKNLLRAANDLNCQAKDECEDQCTDKNKVDVCEDKCEKEFECEEEKEDDCAEKGDCDISDECGEDDECGDKNPSTKGTLYEEEKTGCKRC